MAKRTSYKIDLDVSGLLKRNQEAIEIIKEESVAMAEEIGDFGENEMKAIILTSGTRFSDAARKAGVNKGPGRYRTGRMYKAVSSKVNVSGDNVSAEYGWTGQLRKYFLYQDQGFRNRFIASYTGSGSLRVSGGAPVIRRNPYGGYKNTPGMFALRDSRKSVERELPRLLKKYRTRITKRINRGNG